MKIGLTSVTFRKLPAEKIVELAALCRLDGIEWGGDIHLVPGDKRTAKKIKRLCESNALEIFSYGSYYSVDRAENYVDDFLLNLETCLELGVKVMRIWSCKLSFDSIPPSFVDEVAEKTAIVADIAAKSEVKLAFEHHMGTLTYCAQNTCALLDKIGRENVYSYWQPLNDDENYNLKEINTLSRHILNVHLFHWKEGKRLDLKSGSDEWKKYIAAVNAINPDVNLIMEFVKDDDEQNFIQDAAVLRKISRKY